MTRTAGQSNAVAITPSDDQEATHSGTAAYDEPGERIAARVRPPQVMELRRQQVGAITLGDSATLQDGPELLRLLMRPYGNATAPLGRGLHPMTAVPLGLAIDAAIEAAGGYALDVTSLRYCHFSMEAPTSNRRPLRATAEIAEIGRRHVEASVEVWEVDRLILRGRMGLCRVRAGRALSLADRTRLE